MFSAVIFPLSLKNLKSKVSVFYKSLENVELLSRVSSCCWIEISKQFKLLRIFYLSVGDGSNKEKVQCSDFSFRLFSVESKCFNCSLRFAEPSLLVGKGVYLQLIHIFGDILNMNPDDIPKLNILMTMWSCAG